MSPRIFSSFLAALFVAGLASAASAATLRFADRDWHVRDSGAQASGPGPNVFSNRNVHVDEDGRLHLRVQRTASGWTSAEVFLTQSLGYGTYEFELARPVAPDNARTVLGLFTWSDSPAHNHRELDVEFSRWGHPLDPNDAQYVVQPYQLPGAVLRWASPSGSSAHRFTWTPGKVFFQSTAPGWPTLSWSRGEGIPVPGDEVVHLNLWLFEGKGPEGVDRAEAIVSNFRFTPYQAGSTAQDGR